MTGQGFRKFDRYASADSRFSYYDISDILGKRDSKKLENNTYLIRIDDNTLAIRLHNTNILVFNPTSVSLYSRGYRTHTTKERLNVYAPIRVGQHNGLWYAGTHLFYEGITFDYSGNLLSENQDSNDTLQVSKAMKKRISAYASKCIEAIQEGIQLPSGADCWFCAMVACDSDASLGDKVGNTSHLLEHMEEKYIVPSLILNAMKESGYSNQQFFLHCGYDETGTSGKRPFFAGLSYVKRSIYKYLVKRLVTAVLP